MAENDTDTQREIAALRQQLADTQDLLAAQQRDRDELRRVLARVEAKVEAARGLQRRVSRRAG